MKNTSEEYLSTDDLVLVTGAAGFIGAKVVNSLLERGWKRIRCFTRPSSNLQTLTEVISRHPESNVELIQGNMLSQMDCDNAVKDVKAIFHLVTGRGKLFSACFQNSVVTTKNILESVVKESTDIRFVNVSSFAVYSNFELKRGALFDENCSLETNLKERYDAYVYAKLKQDELMLEYHEKYGIPYAILRPGYVIGPGKKGIPGAVGINTFGIFFHLGGGNRIPLTYVDNCADAIVLAGLNKNINGDVFNVVDDSIPTSRQFLKRYKKEVRKFSSIRIPYSIFYFLCFLWEWYATKSGGQLPPVFNRRFCAFQWKGHAYSNQAMKTKLNWKPEVSMENALNAYFESQ